MSHYFENYDKISHLTTYNFITFLQPMIVAKNMQIL